MESLYEEFKKFDTEKILKNLDSEKIFPKITDRKFWESLPQKARNDILNGAEKSKAFKYNILSASKIMEYSKTGNRAGFEKLYFENRKMLCRFVIAECIGNTGEYTDIITDGLWLMCEESSWALPAHYFLSDRAGALPDISDNILDLYACETASFAAAAAAVLEPVLKNEAPELYKRLVFEVNRRVIKPFIERNDLFWMGFTDQNAVNNWNPWCCCNCLAAALLLPESTEIMVKAADKAVKCIDVFYKGMGSDGGCDEGPGYWDRAAASLFELCELLYFASDKKINFGGGKNAEIIAFTVK